MHGMLALTDLSVDELNWVFERADELEAAWGGNRMPRSLESQRVALWFHGHGFRNRLAFEIGARALGADVSYVPGELGIHEPLEDVGPYLENWFTLLVVRAKEHSDVVRLSETVSIPVINARTNWNHPCEILGDLHFLKKRRGSLDGLNVVFVGAVTNLCMSWFEAAVRLPIHVTQTAPPGYEVDLLRLKSLNENALGHIAITHESPSSCIDRNTDVVYTDGWPKGPDESHIRDLFLPYQVTSGVLGQLREKAAFLPCPPVTRGQEVSEDAMRSPSLLNGAAKGHLLHAQNALMELLVSRQREL
jgi:ornithine carbamoyltransferase